MPWQAPRWITALFADKAPKVEQPPPVKYNQSTGLPTVQSTVARSEWHAARAPRPEQTSWTGVGGGTRWSAADRDAAATGHPAGGAMRQDQEGYRRGWRTRNSEHTPPPPTLHREPPRQERPFYQPPVVQPPGGGGDRASERPFQARPGDDRWS